MADVRSLLRNERAQRRIIHPQATYTATGTLECTVCHIPLKSDQEIWSKHLKSTQHAMRQERLRLSTPKPAQPIPTREPSAGSKKRKADDGDDDSRKRTKPVIDIPGVFFENTEDQSSANIRPLADRAAASSRQSDEPAIPNAKSITIPSHPISPPTNKTQVTIDEDEWAAFERDVATPPPDPSLPSALTAEATISAAPLTAAELAVQLREQATQQTKDKREAETEGEKEDAARALEEEFDEMEGLEERVARLRKMREELRVRRPKAIEEDRKLDHVEVGGDGPNDTDESDDEEDDIYGWDALCR